MMDLFEAFEHLDACYEDLNDDVKAAQARVDSIEAALNSKIEKLAAQLTGETIEVSTRKGSKVKKNIMVLDNSNIIKMDADIYINVGGGTYLPPYYADIRYVDNAALNKLAEEIRTLTQEKEEATKAVVHAKGAVKADNARIFQQNLQKSDDIRAKKKAEMAKERAEERAREKAELSKAEWDALTDEEKANVEKEAAEKAAAAFADKYANIKLSAEELKDLAYTMGWLAGHVTSVRASAPYNLTAGLKAELEDDSSGEPTNLADNLYEVTYDACMRARARQKTPQYAVALSLYLDAKLINSEGGFIAPAIANATGFHKEDLILNNTRLIWKFVKDYGLKFGRKQDVDYMRSMWTTPEDLEKFELGFNAKH